MAAVVKSYFLAPNWDYQQNGPLALGNVISDPSDPVFTKRTEFPWNIYDPPATLPQLTFPMPKIERNPPQQWAFVESEMHAGRLNIFASFLKACGADFNAGVAHGSQMDSGYEMESLQTSYFVPDDDYIRNRLREPGIALWLAGRSWYQSKSLYMITGVKIARGLVLHQARSRETSASANASADATQVGIPVRIGASGEYQSQSKHEAAAMLSTDIVFAYQLRKISVTSKGAVSNEPHNSGTFMNIGTGSSGQHEQPVQFNLGSDDVTLRDIDKDGDMAMELAEGRDIVDGEECHVIWPTA